MFAYYFIYFPTHVWLHVTHATVAGEERYHHSRSRYTQDVTTNLSVVQRPNLLTLSVDTHRIAELKQEQLRMQSQSVGHAAHC